ncbi:uncharacterized protein TM35_000025080 [Trypanosoma theileri]|uniref:Uncharacterized protein n=1 Tax=Trypanosoma theileri TaxID=67003 RepID=A0A1X0P8D3_9TRYP|nr:uncharacterized protein TM35_000025080 [Trypanosoma theileri]ORC93182.1 hypothetical protein TM35_000025080 [Trypanosoma theileri]
MVGHAQSRFRKLLRLHSSVLSRTRHGRLCLLVFLCVLVVVCFVLSASPVLPAVPDRASVRVDERIDSMQSLSDVLSYRPEVRDALAMIFDVHSDAARMSVPASFRSKAMAMFSAYGGTKEQLLQAIETQRIIEVWNRVTGENAVFNNIRSFRPGGGSGGSNTAEKLAVTKLYTDGSGEATCDFCSKVRTAEDIFGRITGNYSYTASNVAKLSKWHGLIITNAHNPLAFDEEVIADIITVSHKWFKKVHSEDPLHIYPNIICDIGKKASASQIHLHLQMALTRYHYFSGTEQLLRAAAFYSKINKSSYWNDIVFLHDMIGLSVSVGDCVILSNICPRKEKELFVLCKDPESPSFARAIAIALMTLRDAADVHSLSFVLSYPPFGKSGDYHLGDIPAFMRVIDRGSAFDSRADTGALEYFGSTYIATDPYKIVPHILKMRQRLYGDSDSRHSFTRL